MKKVKKSPYIHTMKNSLGECIILDTYNSKIYKVDSNKEKLLLDLLNAKSVKDDNVLYRLGILVDEHFDTEVLYETLYQEFQNDKSFLHLVILPTERCNFRCVYCYEDHIKREMSRDLQEALIKYVESRIDEYKGLRIEWFGGEPLCAQETINYISEELISLCKKRKIPYYAGMTTNGYFLDIDTFKQMFKKNKIMKYQITIDGVQELHDAQRYLDNKTGTFDAIVNNLKAIRDQINSHYFVIVIRCNITKDILKRFDEYVDFINNEFGNDPRFEILWKIAWKPGTNCLENYDCVDDVYCAQDQLHDCLRKYKDKILRFGTNRTQYMKYGNICYGSNPNSLVIGSDGNLYKCTVAFDRPVNHVGKLNLDGTVTINQKNINYWTKRKPSTNKSLCKQCSIFPSCLGIYCGMNNETSDGKFVCAGMKSYIDDYLEHISKIDYFTEDIGGLL